MIKAFTTPPSLTILRLSNLVAKGDPMAALLTQLDTKTRHNADANELEQEEIIYNQEKLKKHEEQLNHIDRTVHRVEDEIEDLKSQVNKLVRNK